MMVYVRLCLFLYIQLNGVFLLSFAEFHLQNTTDMTDMAYTTLWYPVPLIYTHPNQICMSISCSIRRVSTGQPHKTRFPSGDHRAETTKWLVPCKVHDVSGWARNIMVPGPQWSPMVPNGPMVHCLCAEHKQWYHVSFRILFWSISQVLDVVKATSDW